MAKILIFLLVMGFIFFQGCSMAQKELIAEILSSEPERFKPLDVTPAVLRYIPLGKERDAVISELTAQGFKVKEVEQKIDRCAECDPLVVLGSYTKKAAIPFWPDKSYMSLRFGFKQGKLVYLSAWYTINVY